MDGHSFQEISQALKHVRKRESGQPIVLIANTIKGKGISFMEDQPGWHHNVPQGELLETARKELATDA